MKDLKPKVIEVMKASVGILLVVFLFSFSVHNYKLIKSLPVQADIITTDVPGNLYVLRNQTLEKYDADGKLLKTYTHKNSGPVTSVDARNSLKVMLYFGEFSQVVFLDNTLSPIGEPVNLTTSGFTQPGPVCASSLGGMWVYHGFNSELVKLSDQYKRTQTVNLSNVLDLALKPDFMLEAGDRLYLNNPASGILVFDSYGTYIKTIPLKSLKEFQVLEDNVIFLSEGKLKSYNMKSFEEQELKLPADSVLGIRIEKNRMYLKKKDAVEVYAAE